MIDVKQFRLWVISPTLAHMEMWSPAAEQLMIGTAIQESRLTYLKQFQGPAQGVYQIEPATHDDIWNYLGRKPRLEEKMLDITGRFPNLLQQLATNLSYATAMARLVYWRKPEPLPEFNDIRGLAQYWKQHYNTPKGRGRVDEFASNYKQYVGE